MRYWLAISILLPISKAFAQAPTETRTIALSQIEEPRQIQEFINLVRSICEVREVTADWKAHTITVTGNPDQLALVGWLRNELDHPADARPGDFEVSDTTFNDARSPAIKVFNPVHLTTPQQLQEAINGVRSIAEAQRVVSMTAEGAIVLRSDADHAAFAEWVLREADTAAAGKAPREASQYTFTDPMMRPAMRVSQARVYHPAGAWTAADLQETVNALRVISGAMRVAYFTAGSAIALRGSDDQVAIADWLIGQLVEPTPNGEHQYEGPALKDQIVRAFFPSNGKTPQELLNDVAQVRQSAGIQWIASCTRSGAVIVRGTADQVSSAASVLP